MKIRFVRRGYSASGGAEAYLLRLANALVAGGHEANLFASADWPEESWPFGSITRVRGESPAAFADDVARLRATTSAGEILFSFERLFRCDIYRAGDGVHRAWLGRRKDFESGLRGVLRGFDRKHREILELEESLFRAGRAAQVIANSRMVRDEIVRYYNYPTERIAIVHNGVPVAKFSRATESREKYRARLRLAPDEIAVLFAGSGWERKGLRFAIRAVEGLRDSRIRLFVAGRGKEEQFRSSSATFLGEVADMAGLLGAADIFLLPTTYDPFSNACLEALAAGLPVITTRANGFAEIMTEAVHGSIIDEPQDEEAIRRALRVWIDPARRARAEIDNAQLAARFDISANVAQTLQILTAVSA